MNRLKSTQIFNPLCPQILYFHQIFRPTNHDHSMTENLSRYKFKKNNNNKSIQSSFQFLD